MTATIDYTVHHYGVRDDDRHVLHGQAAIDVMNAIRDQFPSWGRSVHPGEYPGIGITIHAWQDGSGRNQIARDIVEWRRLIASTIGLSGVDGINTEIVLCQAWNWATAPYRAMTDREHRACRRFARAVDRAMSRYGVHWRETDSGRRVGA